LADLSKERQVIVATQDEDFLSMLEKASSSLKTVEQRIHKESTAIALEPAEEA
jgi:predicted ATPase